MMNWIRTTWCKSMHDQAMWPIHGRYVCTTCLREYPVEWEVPATQSEYADPALRHTYVPYTAEHRLC
jgi:hypothetical protein